MSKAIVLTQYSAPGAAMPASAGVAAGARRVCYRGLQSAYACASIDYTDELAWLEAGDATSALPAGVARYLCVETEDSGPYEGSHGVLMIVAFQVPQERSADVERWYREEHGPMLLRAPGWLRMRRYRLHAGAGGTLWTHLALHELRDGAVLDSQERALARSTAWRAQLERESWFAQAGRFVYEVMPC